MEIKSREKGWVEMKWAEIRIHTSAEASEAVANIFHEAGVNGVVIEDSAALDRSWEDRFGEIYQLEPNDFPDEGVIIKAYLPDTPSLEDKIQAIQREFLALQEHGLSLGPKQLSVVKISQADWENEWKKYYKPLAITERITIKPLWEPYTRKHEKELVIEMDPGMAFGTGSHPSTILSIRALEKHVQTGHEVVDIGCGSGILSVVAAKLGAKKVLALDLDEVAVEATRQNARLNHLADRIEVRQNNLLDDVKGNYDVVVANIIAEVIIRLASAVPARLKAGGCFIASGIIAAKKEEVLVALEQAGFRRFEDERLDDWVAICARV